VLQHLPMPGHGLVKRGATHALLAGGPPNASSVEGAAREWWGCHAGERPPRRGARGMKDVAPHWCCVRNCPAHVEALVGTGHARTTARDGSGPAHGQQQRSGRPAPCPAYGPRPSRTAPRCIWASQAPAKQASLCSCTHGEASKNADWKSAHLILTNYLESCSS
jgi:hypothetical protein